MEYFKSSFKSVLGAPQNEEKDSYADTVRITFQLLFLFISNHIIFACVL